MVQGSFFSQPLVVLLLRARENGNGAGLQPRSFVSPVSPCFVEKGKITIPRKDWLLYPEACDFPSLLYKMSSIILIFHIRSCSSGQETRPFILQKVLQSIVSKEE